MIHDNFSGWKLFIPSTKRLFWVSNTKSTRKKIWKITWKRSLTKSTLNKFHICCSVLIFDFEQVDVNWDCYWLCFTIYMERPIPLTVSKIMSFPVFSWISFCEILFKYKLVRKIWDGKFFSFWCLSFEEKLTCWKWPNWLLSGRCSLQSKLGEYSTSKGKEICDTLPYQSKFHQQKVMRFLLSDENFTDQYFHWAIFKRRLSTNYYIETKVFSKECFYRLIFWLR